MINAGGPASLMIGVVIVVLVLAAPSLREPRMPAPELAPA